MAEILKRPKSRQYDVTDVGRFAPRGEKQKSRRFKSDSCTRVIFYIP